jgi:hypothetical protein
VNRNVLINLNGFFIFVLVIMIIIYKFLFMVDFCGQMKFLYHQYWTMCFQMFEIFSERENGMLYC